MRNKKLENVTNLYTLGQDIKQTRRPLVLMFSQEHCGFCKTLKTEILHPMLLNKRYDSLIIMRELLIDDDADIIGFNNKPVNPQLLFNLYNLIVTPSILLLDHVGEELAERLVGVNTVEMYGGYLDQSIDEAVAKLKS